MFITLDQVSRDS